ncbi:MAG: hypothetical protein KDI75_06525 [Xanthomonadales bacterium]|nr:hypothetical protein [Xanthomonadales bacterium]
MKQHSHHRGYLPALLVLFFLAPCSHARADPPLLQTPTSEHFNGIAYSPDGQFGVAVGNAGAIIHFDAAHPTGVAVASGTSADLFDVHVLDRNSAVASGFDATGNQAMLLTWDGSSWSAHPNSNWSIPILPVWQAPEKDIVMFDFAGGAAPFDFRGGFDLATNDFFPSSYAGDLDLNFCGHSNDIKVVNEDGDIGVVSNDL